MKAAVTIDIVNAYRLDNWGIGASVLQGQNFYFSHCPDWLWGPLSLLSLGVTWLGHEADNSATTSAKVKKMWIYTFTPPCIFMV
jgi:hypothetical protein